jgi:parvulin-like peptidyl-prolyl isomerase
MSGRRWLGCVLAGGLALACVAGSLSAQLFGPKPLAVVNGEPISVADVDAAIKQMGPVAVQLPEARLRQMRMQMVGLLIDDALMRQFLTKNAPPVSTAEIDRKVAEIVEGLKKEGKTLAEMCRETHRTEAKLRSELGCALQWQYYASARVSDIEVQRYYHEVRDFFDGTTVRASHIFLPLAPDAPAAEVEAGRAKLAAVRAEILAGKMDFAAAAKAYSQCTSAEGGGDLGFFPRKWVVEESFARAAFALQPGQVSEVVRTSQGLHIIHVTERKAGKPSEFDKIKSEVREYCVEDMRQGLLAEMRRTGKVEINVP